MMKTVIGWYPEPYPDNKTSYHGTSWIDVRSSSPFVNNIVQR
ncbi:MAG: hypothetical protein PXX83_00605 [Candidatus Nitrosotalea sp.]|nr:hypothetical protein [Candidatus Nitrosotalea sp.]